MRKSFFLFLMVFFVSGCAHQDLKAPCNFWDRAECGPKLPLEKVVI